LPSDDDDFNIFEILKAVPVISTLTAMELEELAKKLKPRKFAKDEYMMQFGEDGNEFFIIISGVCKVLNKEGHQVAELGSGDFVGEMALLEKKPRNATVLCVENCETLVADKPLFESVLGENSSVRFAKRHAKRNAVLTVYKDEEEEKVDVVQRINPDAEIEWISECVSDNILFVNLESRSKLDIIKKMYLEEVEENYDLIKQKAEKADTFYVIKEGSFAVIINGTRVSKLVKGECFGELALMHDAPRAATIRAIEKSKVWTLERSNFRRAVTDAKKKMRKQRLGWLKEVELFKCLNETQLHDVDDALEEMVYSRDQVILREGAVGDRFYIVKSGCVKWETSHGETGERSKGEYFGERALINNQTRAATVTARVQSVCLELNKRDFEALLGTVYDNMKKNIEIEIAASQTFMKQQSLAKDSMLRDDILDVRYSGTKLEDLETVGILGRGRIILLSTSYNSSLKQENDQRMCKVILDSIKVDYDDIDGAVPENKELREKLWAVSKKRGLYPQVFHEDAAGKIKYIGDYEVIQHLNEHRGKGVLLLETFRNYIKIGEDWESDSRAEEVYSMSSAAEY